MLCPVHYLIIKDLITKKKPGQNNQEEKGVIDLATDKNKEREEIERAKLQNELDLINTSRHWHRKETEFVNTIKILVFLKNIFFTILAIL